MQLLIRRCLLGISWLLWATLGSPPGAQAQQPAAVAIELVPGPAVVPLTATYSLGVRLRGVGLASHSDFPELEGFRKAGLTKTTATPLVAGRRSVVELTLTQRYAPYTEGTYQIPAFDLVVNGQVLHSPGSRVRVAATATATAALTEAAVAPGQGVGSLDQLLGKPKPKYFYEPPDHASLALEADHNHVFVGEGVRVSLYLYLQPADQAVLNFYNFTEQLPELVQQLRQPTAWEVPAAETAIVPDTVRRAGAVYLRFRLAQNTYYPLTRQALRFPPLALTMTKFKLLKKPQPGEEEKLAIYKTYAAPALQVAVRPLPVRPSAPASSVPVGHYGLHEGISGVRFRTGEAFVYTFGVAGAGNASALVLPAPRSTAQLEIYGPDIREEKLPDGTPLKSFRYRLVPHQPGVVPLDSLFQLVFFDPSTARYDILRPELRPEVRGAARATAAARPIDDPFYGPALARADSQLQPLDGYRDVRRYAGWLVGALLVMAAAGWWRTSN